jgi:hypothetical protein
MAVEDSGMIIRLISPAVLVPTFHSEDAAKGRGGVIVA